MSEQQITVTPAPLGGINAYDSIVAMPPTDALTMVNWWPQPYGCSVRRGYAVHASGMPAAVETLAGWFGLDGTSKMFAWSNTAMYDVTNRAAVGAAMVSGLTNARWETVLFTNSAGNFLIAVNGVDNGIIYRPTGVFRITAGDGIVANTWAGLNPANATQVTVHQKRLWAVEKNSTKGWYLPTEVFQGTFVGFDFGPQFQRGGYLQVLTTWTLDDGNGAEDHLVAISSNGEAVVYAGTDPNDPTKWALVGVYFIGAPLGLRCFTKASGDLEVLTRRGVISMTAQLVSTKVESANTPLDSLKIQNLINSYIETYGSLNGWRIIYHPPVNMLLVNIPNTDSAQIAQIAANQITGAWTQFSNMRAASWLSHNNQLYFGDTSGNVQKAWSGFSDGVAIDDTGGTGITCLVQQSYNQFGTGPRQKQVGLYRPVFVTEGEIAVSSEIVYDYVDENLTQSASAPSLASGYWGTGLWNSARWGGGVNVQRVWFHASGIGMAASLKMVTLSASEVLWVSNDYVVKMANGVF